PLRPMLLVFPVRAAALDIAIDRFAEGDGLRLRRPQGLRALLDRILAGGEDRSPMIALGSRLGQAHACGRAKAHVAAFGAEPIAPEPAAPPRGVDVEIEHAAVS